jgi:hypothetical protein
MAITYRGERFEGYNKPKRTPSTNKASLARPAAKANPPPPAPAASRSRHDMRKI